VDFSPRKPEGNLESIPKNQLLCGGGLHIQSKEIRKTVSFPHLRGDIHPRQHPVGILSRTRRIGRIPEKIARIAAGKTFHNAARI